LRTIDLRPRFLFIFLFLAGTFFYGSFLDSMDWPSPTGKMINNFGYNDSGKPLLGIVFEGEEAVLAAEQGELLFQSREGGMSRLPSPLGAWLALDHGDGIISIYSRMESVSPALPPKPARGAAVGNSGNSGWSKNKGVYFSLFDRRERRWINPAIIITPREDTRPPVISSVRLKDRDGRLLDLAQTRTIRQGRYVVSVTAFDTLMEPGESPLAPFRILCMVNGSEVGVLNFETYSVRDGSLMIYKNGLVPARDIYASYPAYDAGEVSFTRGQARLEVIAQDVSGNTRNVVYRLVVE
jgi:murein DD-endopeptidase MepM/ murein hydrolase activator NlpD